MKRQLPPFPAISIFVPQNGISVTLTGQPDFNLTYNVNGVPETVDCLPRSTLLANTTWSRRKTRDPRGSVSRQVP